MDRNRLVLAALAAAGEGATFTPVQVQKLFFLIDREMASHVDGPYFQFQPYDYGPFDRAVYETLQGLASTGLAHISSDRSYRVYRLSVEGYQAGASILGQLSPPVQTYFRAVTSWVRRLSFKQLVASIYQRYPDMKVNSVFQ